MTTTVTVIAFLVLTGAVLFAIFSMLRRFLQGLRYRQEAPYQPFVEANPPNPITSTPGVRTVGMLLLIWGGLHVVAVIAWAISPTMTAIQHSVYSLLAALFVLVAAVSIIVGAIMIMRLIAYGRRMVAWGEFLFGVLAFMMLVLSLMLPGDDDVPNIWRTGWPYLLAGSLLHVILDATLGRYAQVIGTPEEVIAAESAEQTPEPTGEPEEPGA